MRVSMDKNGENEENESRRWEVQIAVLEFVMSLVLEMSISF